MCVFAAGAAGILGKGILGLGVKGSNLFLGSLGLNAATGLGGRSAKKAAANQRYQSALLTGQSFARQQEALGAQLKETEASKAQEKLARTIQALQARGSLRASERAGLTVGLLLRDQERQAANFRESINQSLESARRQYTRNTEGLVAQRDDRRNQLQSTVNEAYNEVPSLAGTLLNVATKGLSRYSSIKGGL